MEFPAKELKGHDILALERFMDTTRHMIEFVVLTHDSPVGDQGDHMRLFLTEKGYEKALETQRHGDTKISRHAAVVEGHILYDHLKKKHGH